MPAPSLGLRLCLLLLSTVTLLSAETYSYIVLQASQFASLIRVSQDGKTRKTIANNAGGEYLAIDRHGDYIVSAPDRLMRVTKEGQVTVIATPPAGSKWGAVAIGQNDDLFVADAAKALVWKITADKTKRHLFSSLTNQGSRTPTSVPPRYIRAPGAGWLSAPTANSC